MIAGGDDDTGKEPTLERATEKSGVLITIERRSGSDMEAEAPVAEGELTLVYVRREFRIEN